MSYYVQRVPTWPVTSVDGTIGATDPLRQAGQTVHRPVGTEAVQPQYYGLPRSMHPAADNGSTSPSQGPPPTPPH